MPLMDGETFLEKSAALRGKDTGVVVMTALPNYLGVKARSDVREVLAKPFDSEELLALARELCP